MGYFSLLLKYWKMGIGIIGSIVVIGLCLLLKLEHNKIELLNLQLKNIEQKILIQNEAVAQWKKDSEAQVEKVKKAEKEIVNLRITFNQKMEQLKMDKPAQGEEFYKWMNKKWEEVKW